MAKMTNFAAWFWKSAESKGAVWADTNLKNLKNDENGSNEVQSSIRSIFGSFGQHMCILDYEIQNGRLGEPLAEKKKGGGGA